MVGAPLTIDIGPGAVAGLAPLLADRRISSGGHVGDRGRPGPGRGDRRGAAPAARQRRHLDGRGRHGRGGHRAARAPARRASTTRVVGIGGGRTLDTAKHAAALSRAADGGGRHHRSPTTASPRRSPRSRRAGARRCFGVQMPIAVVVDLDYVRAQRPGDAALRHRRRRLQPRRDRRLVAGRARARRAGRRRWR